MIAFSACADGVVGPEVPVAPCHWGGGVWAVCGHAVRRGSGGDSEIHVTLETSWSSAGSFKQRRFFVAGQAIQQE